MFEINPLIDVPAHYAYPSGHSTQAHLIAHTLTEVLGDSEAHVAEFFDTAQRIAENREYAGVHYESDSEIGATIAQAVFPMLRVIVDPLITDAISEVHGSPYDSCDFRMVSGKGSHIAPLNSPQYPDNSEVVEDWNIYDGGDLAPAYTETSQWPLDVIGIDQEARRVHTAGEGVRIILMDTAVDFDHPSLKEHFGPSKGDMINLDYPIPAVDKTALSSKGGAHGTAMAGIMVGKWNKRCPLWGIAPKASLLALRCGTYTSDTSENRKSLATALLRAVFRDYDDKTVILVGPAFERPSQTEYTDWVNLKADSSPYTEMDGSQKEYEDPCDPLNSRNPFCSASRRRSHSEWE